MLNGGVASIKLATGRSFTDWEIQDNLLFECRAFRKDISKETSFLIEKHLMANIKFITLDMTMKIPTNLNLFWRRADGTKRTLHPKWKRQLFLEVQLLTKRVYLITSPSIVEHKGQFII